MIARPPTGRKTAAPGGWGLLTALLCVFWLLAGLVESLWFGAAGSPEGLPADWRGVFTTGGAIWGLAALLTPFVVWTIRRANFEPGRRWRSAGLHLAALAGFTIVRGLLLVLLNKWTAHQSLSLGLLLYSTPLIIANTLRGTLMTYAAIAATVAGWDYYQRYRERAGVAAALELEQARLRASLSEARLEALQVQLQPHFLFNALHTLSTLILENNPKAANDLVSHLSRFLRMTLDTANSPTISLTRELEFLDAYLRIQQARFEDRLCVAMEIEEPARAASVPSLILQPLVENSIRHGIGSERGRGTIRVRAAVTDGRLRLEVEDDGQGLGAAEASGNGTGLRNVRERLEQLYPGAHQFTLRDTPGGGTLAAITIPFREAEPEAQAHVG